MFYYISGTVAHTEANLAVLDANGVGYACHTSLNTLSRVKVGGAAKLYTYVHVREDILDIYGFFELQELNCFKLLLGISGVGPRAALSVLSVITPERLSLAVLSGDEKALTAAAGVGKKLAQRILLELKDKMSREQLTSASGGKAFTPDMPLTGGKAREAQTALMVLGYSASEAAQAVNGLDEEAMTVEDMIRQALKRMM